MNAPQSDDRPQLALLGIFTGRQDEMQAFYEKVVGLVVSDTGIAHKFKRRIVFMTSDPRQHHQFVLVARQPGDPPVSPLFQVSFKVQSLNMLRAVRERAMAAGATNFRPMNHGNSWSLYFNDPEQNTVEVYMETPWYVSQPFADDLDFNLTDDQIVEMTQARLREIESSTDAATWSAEMAQRLHNHNFHAS